MAEKATKSKAKAPAKEAPKAEPKPESNEPQAYDVTASANLGQSITGRPGRIARGQTGSIVATPERYARLKRAGLFS